MCCFMLFLAIHVIYLLFSGMSIFHQPKIVCNNHFNRCCQQLRQTNNKVNLLKTCQNKLASNKLCISKLRRIKRILCRGRTKFLSSFKLLLKCFMTLLTWNTCQRCNPWTFHLSPQQTKHTKKPKLYYILIDKPMIRQSWIMIKTSIVIIIIVEV